MSFTIYAELTPRHRAFAAGVHVCASEAAARTAGHTVITHPRGKKYEEVVMPETLTTASVVGPVSVRNHTADELTHIRGVLERLPTALLTRFAEQATGIVCVDWSGQNWQDATHPGAATLLSGGANMDQPRTRAGITESGRRIELTHSAMYELRSPPHGRRGVYTLWHELGHVAYRNHFTPRTVERTDYGESIHTGAEEQPAYAFMWYFVDPAHLTANDRAAFDRLLGGAGTASGTAEPQNPRIQHTVGHDGQNEAADVRVVQQLLNRHAASTLPPLPATGICDGNTIDRIRWFQRTNMGMRQPHGRVDPDGSTWNALVG